MSVCFTSSLLSAFSDLADKLLKSESSKRSEFYNYYGFGSTFNFSIVIDLKHLYRHRDSQ